MIEEREGDLFLQGDLDALGHGVNCQGVMGAGIARPFRFLDENMYKAYKEICYKEELLLGDIFPWRLEDGRMIYNIASQDLPGANARYVSLYIGVLRAIRHAEKNGVQSIGLPRIGCGIGGLEWEHVKMLLNTLSDSTEVKIVVVTPKERM
jgi:O-acetyl-ADP-ribose deacetylase (regulator of RNase III)